MPRKPSVILTPTEKKAAVDTAKTGVKAAKQALAAATTTHDELVKDHEKTLKAENKRRLALIAEQDKTLKAFDKNLNAIVKDHEKALKVAQRTVESAQKALGIAESDLFKLAPQPLQQKAVPSPVEGDQPAV